jgi:hypothetical protein
MYMPAHLASWCPGGEVYGAGHQTFTPPPPFVHSVAPKASSENSCTFLHAQAIQNLNAVQRQLNDANNKLLDIASKGPRHTHPDTGAPCCVSVAYITQRDM